jgi:flagellar hook assembly protein FlgD
LGVPPGPSYKDPTINIFGGSQDRLVPTPNPSHSEFIISFAGSGNHPVSVRVYSVDGRLVRTLADGKALKGSGSVVWDGRNEQGVPVATGTYFAVLEEGGQRVVRKMVLQR